MSQLLLQCTEAGALRKPVSAKAAASSGALDCCLTHLVVLE